MAKRTIEEWEENTLTPLKERFGERKDSFETTSGIPINTIYTEQTKPGPTELLDEYPGEYPFTRGVQPNMYRGRLWTMRQYAGLASPAESNRRFKYLLDQVNAGMWSHSTNHTNHFFIVCIHTHLIYNQILSSIFWLRTSCRSATLGITA